MIFLRVLFLSVLLSACAYVKEHSFLNVCAPIWMHTTDATAESVWLWAKIGGRFFQEDQQSQGSQIRFWWKEEKGPRFQSPWLEVSKEGMRSFRVSGLKSGKRYRWGVLWGSCASKTGAFQTLPQGKDKKVSFLWSADLGGQNQCRRKGRGYRIFRAMEKLKVPFFFFLGDFIYADEFCDPAYGNLKDLSHAAKKEKDFFKKYFYQLEDPHLSRFFLKTVVYPVWDDHEFYDDFSSPASRLFQNGAKVFLKIFPLEISHKQTHEQAGKGRDGIYREFLGGKLFQIWILDTRSFRDSNRKIDQKGKTLLGTAQKKWFLDSLKTSKAIWKIVLTPDPISFPSGKPWARDGWASLGGRTGFEHEFSDILHWIRKNQIKNLIFLTADGHFSASMCYFPSSKNRCLFTEWMTGPLSAWVRRHPITLDPSFHPKLQYLYQKGFSFGKVTLSQKRAGISFWNEKGILLKEFFISSQIH